MRFIVFDLEATCWADKAATPGPPEVIEIGAVMTDEMCQEIDSFDQFVKPTEIPVLSDFCHELTSITQESIDAAPPFPIAIEMFKGWIGINDDYCLCSWGDWDRLQLIHESRRHRLDYQWCEQHINLKEQYARLKMLRKKPGMKKVLHMESIALDGTHHRGIDDARNVLKIFYRYFDFWDFPKIEPTNQR